MKIIQCLECLELTVNATDKIVSFPKELLKDKHISSLYLFSNTEDVNYTSPFKNENLTQIAEIGELGLYLNLFDVDGNHFCKNFSSTHLTFDTEEPQTIIEYSINRRIDWEKSYFEFKGEQLTDLNLLFYAIWNKTGLNHFNDNFSRIITCKIEFPALAEIYQDIKLSQLVDKSLINKPIKKIIASPNLEGYLDLITNKGQIKNIPTAFLQISSHKEFWLDNVIIDFENSYYRARGTHEPNNFLTFIY